MLRAHANMPIEDFISQLRTYVIAMGLGPMVVDCIDRLVAADELEDTHAREMQEAEDDVRNKIIKAVEEWTAKSLGEATAKELIAVIKDA